MKIYLSVNRSDDKLQESLAVLTARGHLPFVAEAAGHLPIEARLRWLGECEVVIRSAQAALASPWEIWRQERAAAEQAGLPIYDGFRAFQEFDAAEKSGAFSILREAERLTSRSRRSSYGHPFDNFSKEAALVNAAFGLNLQPGDMALIEILRKVARQTHCHKRDNLTDIAGYAQTRMLVEEERERRAALAAAIVWKQRAESPQASTDTAVGGVSPACERSAGGTEVEAENSGVASAASQQNPG